MVVMPARPATGAMGGGKSRQGGWWWVAAVVVESWLMAAEPGGESGPVGGVGVLKGAGIGKLGDTVVFEAEDNEIWREYCGGPDGGGGLTGGDIGVGDLFDRGLGGGVEAAE